MSDTRKRQIKEFIGTMFFLVHTIVLIVVGWYYAAFLSFLLSLFMMATTRDNKWWSYLSDVTYIDKLYFKLFPSRVLKYRGTNQKLTYRLVRTILYDDEFNRNTLFDSNYPEPAEPTRHDAIEMLADVYFGYLKKHDLGSEPNLHPIDDIVIGQIYGIHKTLEDEYIKNATNRNSPVKQNKSPQKRP